ncbi:MAG TPA: hypothetical protein VK530_06825 [Candidatus Acidoferrum sp.]|nr:hypothetical protein [Candidatus Acidoferrum sp.]
MGILWEPLSPSSDCNTVPPGACGQQTKADPAKMLEIIRRVQVLQSRGEMEFTPQICQLVAGERGR